MNSYKKILSWLLISSLLLWNISYSFASINTVEKLTTEEIKKVENEIVKLQTNLFNNSKSYAEKLLVDIKKLINYEETWNIKFEIDLDENMFWKANANFNFNNYVLKNANLDSSISWDIDFKLDYTPTYGSWIESSLKTFASMISKDSQIYLLLKDLDFKINDKNISQILEKLKEEFSDNKYIKLPTDESATEVIEMLKSINTSTILTEAENLVSSSLLKPYKKSGNKYILIPTKYACDKYFELGNRINSLNKWYTPSSCRENVYESFIKEFIKTWELYIILWEKNNTLWYYMQDKYDKTTVDFTLVYNDTKIEKVDFIVTPDQKKYKNEWLNFHFATWEYLKLNLNADESIVDFYSELDKNNNFLEIDAKFKSWKDFNGVLTLKDKKINWFFYSLERTYDYKTWKTKLKNVYWAKITWNMWENNVLNKLNLKFVWVDVVTKKAFFVWKIWLENKKYTFSFKLDNTYANVLISWDWLIDNKNFVFNSKYDFKLGWEINYAWNFNLLFDQNDNKNNASIFLNVNNWIKDVFKITIKNTAKREYKDNIKIEAPTDVKELDIEKISGAIYWDHIKDARDMKRISDLRSIENLLEIYNWKNWIYPKYENLKTDFQSHNFPKEEKEWQVIGGCEYWYMYWVSDDLKEYILSSCRESKSQYYKVWNWINNVNIKLYFIER